MKFHVLKKRSFFGDCKEIDASHASLFHGTADRGGMRPNQKNAHVAKEVDRPLCLHKNFYALADLFSPEFALVISSRVRDALRDIEGVSFVPVYFRTLYEFPFREGDFSFYETIGDYFEFERFIDGQSDNQDLHKSVGEYFEVVAKPVREYMHQYQLHEIEVQLGSRKSSVDEILVSRDLLADVPIYALGGHVMTDAIFQKLEPFVNWKYFVHGEGTI